jgi:alpha-tubulin suppressor-like RCC1 family protein
MACGGPSAPGSAPAEPSLGTRESAVCSGASVTRLAISGLSTYLGEMAGNGEWTVSYPANAVRLEYYLDGVLRTSEERPGASGTWYFSTSGIACGGAHTLVVKAFPMVIDSAGNRSTCWDTFLSASRAVTEPCPASSPVSAGYLFTVARKPDGTVWSWGHNGQGQLGDGTTTSRYTPGQVPGLKGVVAVSAGSSHAVALREGAVWAWGDNAYGKLGDGTTTRRLSPVQVPGLTRVRVVAAGRDTTAVLRDDGTVWTWGYNFYGQLGDGTYTDRASPVRVVGLTNVVSIAVGDYEMLALKADGTVWTWGSNGFYPGQATPVQKAGLSNITALSAGYSHRAALKADGTVWAWGNNGYGQLGDGTFTNRRYDTPVQVMNLSGVIALSVGSQHTLALKQDGTVWAWGYNDYGQLGDGTNTHRALPVRVVNLANVTKIHAGHSHSVARRADGTVWTWGYDWYVTSNWHNTPVQVSGLAL